MCVKRYAWVRWGTTQEVIGPVASGTARLGGGGLAALHGKQSHPSYVKRGLMVLKEICRMDA